MQMPLMRSATFQLLAVVSVAFMAMSIAARSGEAIDRLDIPGPVVFDGATYSLGWSTILGPDSYRQEYFPAGQGNEPGNYTEMVLIDVYETGADIMSIVKTTVDLLDQRKAMDPFLNRDMFQDQKTGEVMLDFIMSEKNAAGEYIVEWNAYRYTSHKGTDGKTGVMLFGISRRAYGSDNLKPFLLELKESRRGFLESLGDQVLPVAKPKPIPETKL